MKKFLKRKDLPETEENEPDVLTLIQEIQQQLVSLENKIDKLISQPPERHHDRPYRDRSDRGGREGGFRERSFTQAICSECKKECEVPFRPTGDRPVYCKDCFSKREGGSFEGRRGGRPRSGGFDRGSRDGRHFDKRVGGESRGFIKRRPSGFRKQKERF